MKDTEQLVIGDILARQQLGIQKYGTTLAQNPLEFHQWVQHAYEETLDKALYLKRMLQELERMRERDSKLSEYIKSLGDTDA